MDTSMDPPQLSEGQQLTSICRKVGIMFDEYDELPSDNDSETDELIPSLEEPSSDDSEQEECSLHRKSAGWGGRRQNSGRKQIPRDKLADASRSTRKRRLADKKQAANRCLEALDLSLPTDQHIQYDRIKLTHM